MQVSNLNPETPLEKLLFQQFLEMSIIAGHYRSFMRVYHPDIADVVNHNALSAAGDQMLQERVLPGVQQCLEELNANN